jgi:hypothetical protein
MAPRQARVPVLQKIRAFVEIHCKTRRLESQRTMNLAACPVGSTPVPDESSRGPGMSLALSAPLGTAAVGLTGTRRSCNSSPADEAIALAQGCFSQALVFPAGREAPCR